MDTCRFGVAAARALVGGLTRQAFAAALSNLGGSAVTEAELRAWERGNALTTTTTPATPATATIQNAPCLCGGCEAATPVFGEGEEVAEQAYEEALAAGPIPESVSRRVRALYRQHCRRQMRTSHTFFHVPRMCIHDNMYVCPNGDLGPGSASGPGSGSCLYSDYRWRP